MIQLGDHVADAITGFEGTVTGIVHYITGCDQALVQPPTDEKGSFVENRWFDVDRLTLTGKQPRLELEVRTKPGADTPAPRR